MGFRADFARIAQLLEFYTNFMSYHKGQTEFSVLRRDGSFSTAQFCTEKIGKPES